MWMTLPSRSKRMFTWCTILLHNSILTMCQTAIITSAGINHGLVFCTTEFACHSFCNILYVLVSAQLLWNTNVFHSNIRSIWRSSFIFSSWASNLTVGRGMLLVHKTGYCPDNKHGAKMGPTWGRMDPGGPNVGPMNLTIWVWTKIWDSI